MPNRARFTIFSLIFLTLCFVLVLWKQGKKKTPFWNLRFSILTFVLWNTSEGFDIPTSRKNSSGWKLPCCPAKDCFWKCWWKMNQMRCCVWLVCLIHTATKPSAVQAGDMEVQPQFSPCIQTLGDRRHRGGGWLEFYPSLLEGVASSLPQNSLASHISLSLTSLIESWKARVLSVPLYSGGGGGNT